jgi:hypothetical protein
MANYKEQTEQLPDDVAEELYQEQSRLEQEYFEQSMIDDINASMQLKYTDNDILYVLDGLVDPQKIDLIMGKLNDVWNIKNGVE